MTTEQQALKEQFEAHLNHHYSQIPSSDPLKKARDKVWNHFTALGLPSRKDELFRSIKLRHLFSRTYEAPKQPSIGREAILSHIYPECENSTIVFVNGHYQEHLSDVKALPEQIVICPLQDAVRTYGAFLNNQWVKLTKEEKDPFAALNGALHHDGIFIYVPPKCVVEAPLQILYLIDVEGQLTLMMPRVHLFAGPHSQCSLVSAVSLLSGQGYYLNQVTDLSLEEGAHVTYHQVSWDEAPDAWHFDAVRATLKKHASFKTVQLSNGSLTTRYDYKVSLVGEEAEASLNGMWMLNEKREAHTNVLIDHQAPNCSSTQLFKGVLTDISRSSFEGKIVVKQKAQKTNAFQLNNNLLLSSTANADSKPNLEIFADDVKASHGATVGQLDEEQLFYLKTRGFKASQAQDILIYGFCKEVVDLITLPSLRASMIKKMQNEGE